MHKIGTSDDKLIGFVHAEDHYWSGAGLSPVRFFQHYLSGFLFSINSATEKLNNRTAMVLKTDKL